MRHLLLGFNHPPTDRRSQPVYRHELVGWRRAQRGNRRERRRNRRCCGSGCCCGSGRCCRSGRCCCSERSRGRRCCGLGRRRRQERLDIAFSDPPARARPRDITQVYLHFHRHPPRQRRGQQPPAALYGSGGRGRRGCRSLCASGCRLGCRRRCWCRGARRFNLFARRCHECNRRVYRHHRAHFYQVASQHTVKGRLNFNRSLIRLDLCQHTAFLDRFPFQDYPAHQRAFRHIEAQLGHGHRLSHYSTSLTARTTSATCGSAICSSVRL